MSLEPSSQIVLRADLSELVALNHWIESLSEWHQLPAPLAFRVDLCLTEAVTNVISYAYVAQQCATEAVTVRFHRQGTELIFEIIDRGSPFDPTAYVPAPLPTSLEQAEAGGRGLRLVRQFADILRYRREDDRNHLELVFTPPP